MNALSHLRIAHKQKIISGKKSTLYAKMWSRVSKSLSLFPRTPPPHILGTLHQLGLLQNLHQGIEFLSRQLAVVDTQLSAE